MSDQIKLIAERIKELRNICGKTPAEIAQTLDISEEQYNTYESGAIDIPVSFLYEIAGLLNVELTALLTGEEPRLKIYSLVRSGRGVSADRRKDYKYQSLAYNFMHKKGEPFLVTVDPDENKTPSFNSHPGQEFNYMIEGSMMVYLNGSEITLNEGDSLYFNSSYKHAMKALNGKPARFLAIIMA